MKARDGERLLVLRCAGGCGDNTFYGVKYVLDFLQAREDERNYPRFSRPLARSQLNLWNSFTGLMVRTLLCTHTHNQDDVLY